LKQIFKNKVTSPLLYHLRKGMSVEKMSLTLALGICLGIIPILGVSTWILVILALIFKLNIPAIQLVNYTISIFKYILFVPFLKLGQKIFFPNESSIKLNHILADYQADFFGTMKTFWHMNLGAVIIWALIAIPLGLLIYYKSQPLLKRQKQKLIPVTA